VQPGLHFRRVHIVIVNLPLVSGVVGRIDIDTFNALVEGDHKGLKRFEQIALQQDIERIISSPVRP